MKIVLVHNFYSSKSPSGENEVFNAELGLLRSRGHDVEVYTRSSDELASSRFLPQLRGAVNNIWSVSSVLALERLVRRFRPDIVHAHNTFPLISPAIFRAGSKFAPCVMTLHNYRLFCPAAIPLREGNVCTECIDGHSTVPALRHGCYRGSRVATVPLVLSNYLHGKIGTYTKHVSAFIALSEYQRELSVKGGLPAEKIFVKPNFVADRPREHIVGWTERGDYAVFAGRLSPEKGVMTLLRAWREWGQEAPELRLIGAGELDSQARQAAEGLPVRFMGRMSKQQTLAQIANAKLLVLPSEWYETFGLVVAEAAAAGTPAAVSNLGALPDLVADGQNGVIFPPRNPSALLGKVREAWQSDERLRALGLEARHRYEERYTENVNYQQLMKIYENAMSE